MHWMCGKQKSPSGKRLLSLSLALALGLTAGVSAAGDENPRWGYQKGDPDRDGVVSIADVMEACKVLARSAAGGDSGRALTWSCELTGDDAVTIVDVMELCRLIARGDRPADKRVNTAHKVFGQKLMERVEEGFHGDGYVLEQEGGSQPAFLWPYTAYLNALSAHIRSDPDNVLLREPYQTALQGLLHYDTGRQTPEQRSFAASRGGAGDVYYDDNMWAALSLLDAYGILKDPAYLAMSRQVVDFCYEGWDDRLDGGVYWCESDKTSKHTCSNAPLAIASARLYQLTGASSSLRWAERIYAWTRNHLRDPADGLYYDHLTVDGTLLTGKYACNAGCMLIAALELYESTGKENYREDARELAAAADACFFTRREDGYVFSEAALDSSDPWFYVWLLEGFIKLGEMDRSSAAYIEHIKQAVWTDWVARDNAGAPVPVLKEIGGGTSLIDVCGMAQVFLQLDAWYDLR